MDPMLVVATVSFEVAECWIGLEQLVEPGQID